MSRSTSALLRSSLSASKNYATFQAPEGPIEIVINDSKGDQKGDAKSERKAQDIKGAAIIYVWDSHCAVCLCVGDCCCLSSNKRIGHVSMQLLSDRYQSKRYQPIKEGYISIWPGDYKCYIVPTVDCIKPEHICSNTMVLVGQGNKRTVYFVEDNEVARRGAQLVTTELHLSEKEIKAIGEKTGDMENSPFIRQLIKRAADQAKHTLREANYASSFNHDKNKENGVEPVARYLMTDVNVGAIFDEFKKDRDKYKWTEAGGGLLKKEGETHCSGLVVGLLYKHSNLKERLGNKSTSYGCLESEAIAYANVSDILRITREVLEEKPSCSSKAKRVLKSSGYSVLSLFIFLIGLVTIAGYTLGMLNLTRYSERGNAGKAFIIALLVMSTLSSMAKIYLDIFDPYDHRGTGSLITALRLCRKSWGIVSNCGGITPDDINFMLNYFSNEKYTNSIKKVTYNELKQMGYDIHRVVTMDELRFNNSINELNSTLQTNFFSVSRSHNNEDDQNNTLQKNLINLSRKSSF